MGLWVRRVEAAQSGSEDRIAQGDDGGCHFQHFLAQGRQHYWACSLRMDELVGLSEEARKPAVERFRLLQAHIENNEPLTSVSRATGIPYRTAHRSVSAYRRIGLTALVRKKRADRGERRVVSAKLKEAIAGPTESPMLDTVFFAPDVVNVPGGISYGIGHFRDILRDLARRPRRKEKEVRLDFIRRRRRASSYTFEEHAQNGVRRDRFLARSGGARRTLCASNRA